MNVFPFGYFAFLKWADNSFCLGYEQAKYLLINISIPLISSKYLNNIYRNTKIQSLLKI